MVKSRELPGYSELFLDYIEGAPRVRMFLPFRPERDTLMAHAVRAKSRPAPCKELRAILDEHAGRFGSGAGARRNILKLAESDTVVVLARLTLGALGGTLCQLLKCLTAAALSAELNGKGLSSIPLVSIRRVDSGRGAESSICLLDSDSKLVRLSVGAARAETPAVLLDRIRTMATAGPESEVMGVLQRTHVRASDIIEASAALLAQMTDELGLVFLDADCHQYQALALRSGAARLNDSPQLPSVVQTRMLRLGEAGYALPDQDAQQGWQRFVNDRFFETALFPVAAVISGDAEMYGFTVMQSLFPETDEEGLLVWPRACATVLDTRSRKTLEKYGLKLEDLFSGGQEALRRTRLETAEGEVASRFDALAARVEAKTADLEKFADEDALKAEVAEARQKILYQLEKLRERFLSSSQQRRQAASRQLDRACNTLAPGGMLQERRLGTLYFLLRYSPAVVRMIYDKLDIWNHEHQLLNLD